MLRSGKRREWLRTRSTPQAASARAIEVVTYDNRSSSAESVDAFRRAVNEEKVDAVIAGHISEIVLALGPWATRLKTPLVAPGAASTEISRGVHRAYARNRYTFQGYLTSTALAQSVSDAARALVVEQKRIRTAIIMSEDAAWTIPLDSGYEACLPTIGLTLLDHIRFAPEKADFTAIFAQIRNGNPDVIVTGMTKAGAEPIVQWKKQRVHIPMPGMNSQASNSSFHADTDGAAEGVLYQAVAGPGVAVTPKSIPFTEGFRKRFGNYPSYAGYSSYDEVFYIADAVKRAGSTDAEKLVDALETTDWQGTIGRIRFYGRQEPFAHSLKYGEDGVSGLTLQWQDGAQICVWQKRVAKGPLKFPSFMTFSRQA